ncbi:MAG: Head fiber protein [Clostridia bacterium]|nr:Head fiber protein [Clostridia bacterium]
MGYNAANFRLQGGDVTAFEGTVAFLGSLIIDPECHVEGYPQASNQSHSSATTIADLKNDFNALLDKLISAGIMDDK